MGSFAHSEVSGASGEATGDKFDNSIFYKGDVSVVLDKGVYTPGDIINANITLQNMEDFPIVDAYLIVEIVEGKEHIFPSSQSDDNNVFYEAVVGGINLAPGYSKTVPFSYNLPKELRNGSYLFEVYAETKRTPLVGLPAIFLAPKNALFKTSGGGDFPSAKILPNETIIDGEFGQIGPGVNASSLFSGKVFVQNRQSSKADYLLNVTICKWDDTVCGTDEYVSGKQYAVSLNPGQVSAVGVDLRAPDKPDAYSIRLELSENGRTVSIYRSRIVVLGPTAKIRKMALDKLYLQKGDSGKIMLLVSASPDTYTLPDVRNAKASVSISVDGTEVYSDSTVIPRLSALNDTTGLVSEVFEFTSPQELRNYVVCSKIESEKGELYDAYCFTIDPSKIMLTETVINVSWDYDYETGTLKVKLCARDVSGQAVSSRVTAFLLDKGKALENVAQNVQLDPCSTITINASAGRHDLIVNDLDANRQTTTPIEIVEKQPPEKQPPEKQVSVCGDGVCGEGENMEKCCTDCGCVNGANCLNNLCQLQASQNKDSLLLYASIALIGIGLLIFILRTKRKVK